MDDNVKHSGLYIMLCLIWGTTWLAIRVGLEDFAPFFSAGWRFLIAAVVFALIIYRRKLPVPMDKKSMSIYFMLGWFSFFVPFGMVYWGEQYVSSGLAAILFAVYPFAISLFSYFFLKNEKITLKKVTGMIISFTGVYTIFYSGISTSGDLYVLGMFLIFISALMQAAVLVAFKRVGSHLNAVSVNFIPVIIAGVSFFILSFIVEPVPVKTLTTNGVLSLIYLGIFGTVVTFSAYYYLLKRLSIVLLSFIAFITPTVAVVTGWLVMDETLTQNDLLGSILVIAGLVTANLRFVKKVVPQT